MEFENTAVDDSQTGQDLARAMLSDFCSKGFDGDISAASLALGRDIDQLQSAIDGATQVDDDLMMKVKGIAEKRGIHIG